MASRENQGLHVALILLVILSIALSVTSFMFYSAAGKSAAAEETAKNSLKQAQDLQRKTNFENQMYTYMFNTGAETWDQMATDLKAFTDTPDLKDDPAIAQLTATFEKHMLLFGAADKPYEKVRNYQNLTDFLKDRVQNLNQQLGKSRKMETQLTAEKEQLKVAEAERTKQFEDAQKRATEDLTAERDKFNADRTRLEEEKNAIAAQLSEKNDKLNEMQTAWDEDKQKATEQIASLEKRIDGIKEMIPKGENSFEEPDAIITRVDQTNSELYINVGSKDSLREGQTFSVYDKRQTGVMEANPKGRVKVLRIINGGLSLCRIMEDDIADIIVPGDVVFTPVWSPGRNIHFAFAGLVDINGNGRSDAKLMENLIKSNGAAIDDEVTAQTMYLVRGEKKSGIPGQQELTNEGLADFNNKIQTAQQLGVNQLSVDKLLTLMGWKADVQAVSLREEGLPTEKKKPASGEASPFRKRTPPRGDNGAF